MQLGARLGAYEVLAKLGEGGMGEVYRARDTKLQRDVALKMLPASFAADPERLARFRREAQVLAALNHPNIAQIHGLEEHASATMLVMELVAGETLAARITRGALPVDEALAVARQIADALEAAHGQHIIHRDLKPANIALRADGVVKALDFGLAKAVESSASSGSGPHAFDLSKSPTLTNHATMAGVILGTAAYMAPEQARGKPVDQRADIWAFGCVLFEMLTGRRAFEADDLSLTLARVLERDPDLSWLPASVPSHVRQTLALCLRKDPKQRLSDIRDVRLALEGGFVPPPAAGSPTAQTVTRMWQRPLPLAAAAAVLLAAGVFAGRALFGGAATPPEPSHRLSVVLPPDHEYVNNSTPSHSLAISPDGGHIVLRARRGNDQGTGLYARSLADTRLELIPGTENGAQPAFAPDGRAIVFVDGSTLKRVALGGGLPSSLAESVSAVTTPIWRGDQIFYAGTDRRQLFSFPVSGGSPRMVATMETAIVSLASMRDSDMLLVGRRAGQVDRIEMVTPDSGDIALLIDKALLVPQQVSTHVLFARDGELLAAPLDISARRLGSTTPVLRSYALDSGSFIPQVAISPSGTLVYVVGPRANQSGALTWVDASGHMTVAAAVPSDLAGVDVSPDGALAAIRAGGTVTRVVLWDMQRQVPTGTEFDGAIEGRFHPDGRLALSREGRIVLVNLETGREEVLVAPAEGTVRFYSVAPDGSLAYNVFARGVSQIHALSAGAKTPQVVAGTAPASAISPAISPDGRWIAYMEYQPGNAGIAPQVYVARFPSGSGRRRLSVVAGNEPLWRRDGRALFYREYREWNAARVPASDLQMVPVAAGDALTLGAPQRLFPLVDPESRSIASSFVNSSATYYANPDGSRFLVVFRPRGQPLTEIAVVPDWQRDINRRAPHP